jgi:hypothetical protein
LTEAPIDLRRWKLWAIWLIAAHTIVVAVHSVAHVMIGVVPTAAPDNAIIVICYYAGPIVAAFAITKGKTDGALLLLAVMIAGFAYGFVSHFILDGADNVGFVVSQGWGLAFSTTTIALAILEAAAAIIAWLLLAAGRGRCSGEAAAPTL